MAADDTAVFVARDHGDGKAVGIGALKDMGL
jgi:hypothetical protein